MDMRVFFVTQSFEIFARFDNVVSVVVAEGGEAAEEDERCQLAEAGHETGAPHVSPANRKILQMGFLLEIPIVWMGLWFGVLKPMLSCV